MVRVSRRWAIAALTVILVLTVILLLTPSSVASRAVTLACLGVPVAFVVMRWGRRAGERRIGDSAETVTLLTSWRGIRARLVLDVVVLSLAGLAVIAEVPDLAALILGLLAGCELERVRWLFEIDDE